MSELPVVSDAFNFVVQISSPLCQVVEKIGSPAKDLILGLKGDLEPMVPNAAKSSFNSAMAQVTSAAVSVDDKLSLGIDYLVDKMPTLKEPSPALYESTRSSVRTYVNLAATYLASFTPAHVFLKATDLSLATADVLLESANDKVEHYVLGLRRLRRDVEYLRKQGVELNGTEKAKVLEEATLVGALIEIFGLASFFSMAGNVEASEVEDALDVANMTPTETRSGQTM